MQLLLYKLIKKTKSKNKHNPTLSRLSIIDCYVFTLSIHKRFLPPRCDGCVRSTLNQSDQSNFVENKHCTCGKEYAPQAFLRFARLNISYRQAILMAVIVNSTRSLTSFHPSIIVKHFKKFARIFYNHKKLHIDSLLQNVS